MDNSTRRGPSGIFMALLGICALALLVVMIYGVAVSNPDMVKQLMGVSDQTDDMMAGDMGYGDMYGDMSGDMTGDMTGDMSGDMTDEVTGDIAGDDMAGNDAGVESTGDDAAADDGTGSDADVAQPVPEGAPDTIIAVG